MQDTKPAPTQCTGCGKTLEPRSTAEWNDDLPVADFWVQIEKCAECEAEDERRRASDALEQARARAYVDAGLTERHLQAGRPLASKLRRFLVDDDRSRNGVYLWGDAGTGKTTQLVAAAKWWIDQAPHPGSASVRFVRETDVLRRLREFDDNPSLSEFGDVELLCLDELGTAKATEWSGQELRDLINARYDSMLPTVFASNWKLTDLAERPNYDDRAVSRLLEMCAGSIHHLTNNYRKVK